MNMQVNPQALAPKVCCFVLTTLGFALAMCDFAGLGPLDAAPQKGHLPFERTEDHPGCSDYNPYKNVYWGDLHNHTSYSSDVVLFGIWNDPRDAYRFARGDKVGLVPYDEFGQPLRSVQLVRPLDFNAITDHSEFFAEVQICLTCKEGDEPCRECLRSDYGDGEISKSCEAKFVNSEESCKIFRKGIAASLQIPDEEDFGNLADLEWANTGWSSTNPERFSWCGDHGFGCLAVAANVWSDIQQAAEEAYDRTSECSFTSLVAYEWTGMPLNNNWHRNVIFRNDKVPGFPTTNFETGTVTLDAGNITNLWDSLEKDCLENTPGCDVLTIPHNANLSGGGLFRTPTSRSDARTQADWEPLTEIHQIKGNSECRWGVGTEDELCQFELVSEENFQEAAAGPGRAEKPMPGREQGFPLNGTTKTYHSFIREILKGGLVLGQEESNVGVNPYKLGFVGGTDHHNGTPGATQTRVWEAPDVDGKLEWPGHNGVKDSTREKRLSTNDSSHEHLEYNPGGLTAVWAEENSRDSLFTALRNKEVYATSGTRPTVRVFGGWDLPQDLCDRQDFVSTGYRDGVPMGSDLRDLPNKNATLRFAVQAFKDPGYDELPGTPLQRIQIVKGWIDALGTLHEKVFDIASAPESEFPSEQNYVALDTCEAQPNAPGATSLCTVWTDPTFDPSQPSFYYARVLENPTCRWSTKQCVEDGGKSAPCWERLKTPANCENPSLAPSQEGTEDDIEIICDNPESSGVVVGLTTQQRAWTSPIWYETGKSQVLITSDESSSDSDGDGGDKEVSTLARWRLVQGKTKTPWQKSGATLDNIVPGRYTVEFNSLPGWQTPNNDHLKVESGITSRVKGTYSQDSQK